MPHTSGFLHHTSRSTLVVAIAAISMAAGGLLASCDAAAGGSGARSVSSNAPSHPSASAVDHNAFALLGYRLAWRGFPVMARRATVEHFDFFGDVLAVQDTAHTLTLMEASNGANRWSTTPAGSRTRFLGNVRYGDRLLASSDNELYFIDIQNGDIISRQQLALVVSTEPVLFGDVAVFGTARGRVLGHNMRIGYKQWEYAMSGAIDARPAHVGNLVGVVSQGGDVVIIDPGSGASTSRAHIYSGLSNNPVGGPGALYIAALDQSVYALRAGGGLRWRHRGERPIDAQPTLHADRLYVELPDEGFSALDAQTGDLLWSAADVKGEAVALRAGRLIVWNSETHQATTLDADRGDVIDRVMLPDVFKLAFSAFVDGDLYTATRAGVVAKFTPAR